MLSNTHTYKEKVGEFAWCWHGNNLAADLTPTRSHSCLGQWCQAKPEVSDWGEQQDELWWMKELAHQSINPGSEEKALTDWKWSTWVKRQCCPKNPQGDLDICFHPHHVLQKESSQKLWSDERQCCPGSPGETRGLRTQMFQPCSVPVSFQH